MQLQTKQLSSKTLALKLNSFGTTETARCLACDCGSSPSAPQRMQSGWKNTMAVQANYEGKININYALKLKHNILSSILPSPPNARICQKRKKCLKAAPLVRRALSSNNTKEDVCTKPYQASFCMTVLAKYFLSQPYLLCWKTHVNRHKSNDNCFLYLSPTSRLSSRVRSMVQLK